MPWSLLAVLVISDLVFFFFSLLIVMDGKRFPFLLSHLYLFSSFKHCYWSFRPQVFPYLFFLGTQRRKTQTQFLNGVTEKGGNCILLLLLLQIQLGLGWVRMKSLVQTGGPHRLLWNVWFCSLEGRNSFSSIDKGRNIYIFKKISFPSSAFDLMLAKIWKHFLHFRHPFFVQVFFCPLCRVLLPAADGFLLECGGVCVLFPLTTTEKKKIYRKIW